jgi:hypothetical protein
MSYRAAENVAVADERDKKSIPQSPFLDSKNRSTTFLNLFGPKIRDSTVTRFKLFMVSSFGISFVFSCSFSSTVKSVEPLHSSL